MARPIYCVWKRGENNLYKHGMLVHIYDPLDWGHDEIQEIYHFSPWMETVYFITKHDREEKSLYENALIPIGDFDPILLYDETAKNYRHSGLILDETKLITETSDSSIGTKILPGLRLPKYDLQGKGLICTDSTKIISFPAINDIHVIASGDYTYGSGGDYADIVALAADLTTATGTFNFTCISSQTTSARALFNTSFGGQTVNFLSNSPHGGNVNAGYTISGNTNLPIVQFAPTGDNSSLEFKDISIKRVLAAAVTTHPCIRFDATVAGFMAKIHDLFLDGNGLQGTCAWLGRAGGYIHFYNVSARDATNQGIEFYTASSGTITVEQCLAEGCGIGLQAGSEVATVRNCGYVGNTTDVSNISNATGSFVISEDATAASGNWGTGSNCITGVTPADEWELDDTIATYAAVKSGAPNADTSTDSPTLSANLMDGSWTNEIGPKIILSSGGHGPLLSDFRNRLVL